MLFCITGVTRDSFSGLSFLVELILSNNYFSSFPDIYVLKGSLEVLKIGKVQDKQTSKILE